MKTPKEKQIFFFAFLFAFRSLIRTFAPKFQKIAST